MYIKIWTIDKNFQSNYKYIELMVDDLIIFSKHPALMIQPLKEIQKYELKGVSAPGYESIAYIEC